MISLLFVCLVKFYLAYLNDRNQLILKINKQIILSNIFFLILVVALFRSAGTDEEYLSNITIYGRILILCTLILLIYSCFKLNSSKDTLKVIIDSILLGGGCYILINLIGVILGIENQFVYNEQLLQKIDQKEKFITFTFNSYFPFSNSNRSLAIDSGLIGSFSAAYFFYPVKNKYKYFSIVIFFCCLIIIFLCDIRVVWIGLITVLIMMRSNFLIKYSMKIMILSSIIIPILFLFLTYLDTRFEIFDLLTFFGRKKDPQELITLNSRTYIWAFFFIELLEFDLIHFFGHGAFSHIVTGLSSQYGTLGYYENPELVTSHNNLIQFIFDIGYFGMIVFLILINNTAKILTEASLKHFSGKIYFNPLLAGLIYIMVCGIFDILIYYTALFSLFFFIITSIYSCFYQKDSNLK
jgi:hypothetical protein